MKPYPQFYSNLEVPKYWDLDPQHPDYITIGVYPGITGDPTGATMILIIDRYGNIYVGLGLNVCRSLTSTTVSGTGGYIGSPFDNIIYNQLDMQKLLNGWGINLSGGIVSGGGITWSSGATTSMPTSAWEYGVIFPASIGGSITYSWQMYKWR